MGNARVERMRVDARESGETRRRDIGLTARERYLSNAAMARDAEGARRASVNASGVFNTNGLRCPEDVECERCAAPLNAAPFRAKKAARRAVGVSGDDGRVRVGRFRSTRIRVRRARGRAARAGDRSKVFRGEQDVLRLERRDEEARADGRRAGDRVHRVRVRKVRPVEFERRRQ